MFSCIFQCEKTKADICIYERREAGFSKLKQIYSRRPLWICSKKRSLQICSVLLSFNQNLGSTDIFERSWVFMEEEASTGMSSSCIFQSEPGFSEFKMGCIQEKLVFFFIGQNRYKTKKDRKKAHWLQITSILASIV